MDIPPLYFVRFARPAPIIQRGIFWYSVYRHLRLLVSPALLGDLECFIKLSLYRKIFEKAGIADISLVDDDRQDIVYFGKLMRAVVSCLIAESEDTETEGFLFERDIYRSLRDSNKLNNPPTMEAISNMLQFLSSPLVGCVEKTKDGYYATGSLSDVARKFAFYSRNCFDD